MKLHANARTCPKSRRLLVSGSKRRAGRWRRRPRPPASASEPPPSGSPAGAPRARPGLLDRSSAPKRGPTAAARRAGRGDRGAAAAADDRRRDRRVPGDGALDRLAVAEADRARQALAARAARAAQPLRAKAPRRAGPRRRQEARADPRGAGHRVTGNRRDRVHATPRGYGVAGWEFVHVCVDDATRLAYVEVLADERGETAAGFLRRAVAWFASMGITRRAGDERQRLLLPLARPRRRPAASSASATCSPGPTGRAPTARPSASSRRSRTAGPTERSTATQPSAPRPCPAGSPTTTSPDDMAPSATSRPQLGSPSWNNVLGSYT